MSRLLDKVNLKTLTAEACPQLGYPDGGGLFLVVTKNGHSWVIRFNWGGTKKQFIVGAWPAMSLTDARGKATLARTDVKQGIDPRDRYSIGDKNHTFETVARKHIPDWIKNQNWRAKEDWERMLRDCKALCGIPVAAMTNDQVFAVFSKLWGEKPKTAARHLNKVKKVMDVAIVDGLRKHANPAIWKGNLSLKLDDPSVAQLAVKGTKRRARVSLPFADLPEFMKKLSYDTTIAARAVEFAILTGGRSQEARLAEWSMIDFKRGLFNVPARLMKGREDHTVVLCKEAIALLNSLPRRSKYIFPSDHTGLDEAVKGEALLAHVRLIAPVDLHGFRSTFRNYAGPAGVNAAFETAEAAIAHKIGTATTRAYFNDPLFAARAELMAKWGEFACSKRPKGEPGNVVRLRTA